MVEVVTDLSEAGGLEAVSFIDDGQFDASAGARLGMDVGPTTRCSAKATAYEVCWYAQVQALVYLFRSTLLGEVMDQIQSMAHRSPTDPAFLST